MSGGRVEAGVDVSDLPDQSLHVADIVSIDGDLRHLTVKLHRLQLEGNELMNK